MLKFTFDHTQKEIFDACGVTEKQIKNLFERINDIGQSCSSSSEIIEKIGTNFTSAELAFIVNHLQMQVRNANDPLSILRDIMDLDDGIDIEDNDNDVIHLPPLGQGGEA